MLKTRDIRIELDDSLTIIKRKIAQKFNLPISQIVRFEYARKSIDARNKTDIFFVCSFYIWMAPEYHEVNTSLLTTVQEEEVYAKLKTGAVSLPRRPIVVGFGPCGMFIGLYLAKLGCKPIIIERGERVELRAKSIDDFLRNHTLNTQSNIQFGEGGAGTFSDGKLTTNNKDEKIKVVINELIHYGAPTSIFYDNKPHIGTDRLIHVVKNIRNEIIALGGEVLFEHTLVGIEKENNQIRKVTVSHHQQESSFECQDVFLAIGHSARDTFQMLYDHQIVIQPKPFAMGVRIEHHQAMINQTQYGPFSTHPQLKPADYKLVTQLPTKRTVYSFCMCPGGVVVNASSDKEGICCNGMSFYARDGVNANSALLVNVAPQDFPSTHPLAGMYWQQEIERKAYQYSHSHALIIETLGSFLYHKTNEIQSIKPSCRGPYIMGNIAEILPPFITQSLQMALPIFEKTLKGFSKEDALLIGVETRSSSPIRIERNLEYTSVSCQGLYPCGEGAGYSGGIITSAIDGIKCVETILRSVYNIDL